MRSWVLVGILLLSLLVLLPNSWMADDAYITLRTVDHLCHGRGLIYNPGERVQAYTHPLWMFALAGTYWVTGAHYWGSLALGLVCSLLTIAGFVSWHGRHAGVPVALVLVLLGSRAFVDFSSSGLENPLTHLLVVVFYARFFRDTGREPRRWLLSLTLTTSVLMLCRVDAVLLVLPALLSAAWQVQRASVHRASVPSWAALRTLALGMAPWLAWEAFTLLYYGAFVPNTALAKVYTGLPRRALIEQGWLYVLDGVGRDPWTLLVIAAAVLMAVIKPAPGTGTLTLGLLLYLGYVVFIGGDYMSGRFFTAPLVLACVSLSRAAPQTAGAARLLGLAAVVGACLAVRPTWSLDFEPRGSRLGAAWDEASGVVDEQTFWYRGTGVLNAWTSRDMPASKGRDQGERSAPGTIIEAGAAGMTGFFAPPDVHVLEPYALVDAFLARLPALPDFRPGHFRRAIPDGYKETLESGENQLKDARLRRLYDDVQSVTRGPLFRAERLKAMWRLHVSRY